MLDSDVDSWYDWKQGDNTNEMYTGSNDNTKNGVQLISSDCSRNFISDDSPRGNSRSNGLICYGGMPTSSRSGPEIRFINPAIYAETLNNEDVEHEVEIRVKVSSKDDGQIMANCGDSAKINNMMSALSIDNNLTTPYVNQAGDQVSAQETYRCYSLNSPGTSASLQSSVARSKSVTSCRSSNGVERRCKIAREHKTDSSNELYRDIDTEEQRYTINGHRIVQVSTSSLSSIRISEDKSNESDLAKKISYTEWTRRKEQVARRKKEEEDQVERKKQEEVERLAREKEDRESRERENFLKWSKRKKKEKERKKAVVEKEMELQKQLKQVEDKASVVKTLYLRQWARKKKEEEKARQKKEEIKQKQIEEERKKRLEDSTKAYEKWRKTAKNKPKPATQGLLPHQKAKPAYVNPTPWQRIVDDIEDFQEDVSDSGRKTQN
ncbi:hypothetical protein WH47_00494 [Habropoda laboriosa]|uniref:Coiled-coil domain-containing protein n=1 Tax=Habropoda laboriosa TaxID=597456 RepID=A0A0L7R3W9_9HYME|nr:PREDICTED: inner centromere protein A-like [Habropoda laboriosa]KOC65524.1 hypothetical protein WH47_00494 [Habropoda laboriosa]